MIILDTHALIYDALTPGRLSPRARKAIEAGFANRELVVLYTPVPPKNQLWQNQITLRPKAVPAPPGIVLAGIGFLGLLGRARLMRRKIAG